MVCQNIVMPGTARTTPQPAVTVIAFMVQRASETLTDQAPLDRQVRPLIDREDFVYTPTCGAVVNDDVAAFATKAILLFTGFVARTETHVSNDQIMGIEVDLVILDADSITGRGLACNRKVRVSDLKFRLQRDRSRDAEDNSTRSFGLACCPETARTVILQIGDFNYFSPTPPDGVFAKPFGARK